MTAKNPNAMPQVEYARLGGQAVFEKYGVEGMRAMGAKAEDGHVKGGKVQGNANVESGFLDTIRNKEEQRRGGQVACCRKWHKARGIFNPKCVICVEGITGQNHEK